MRTTDDKLELFARENRQGFDRYQPPASLRSRIFASTRSGRKMLIRRRMLLAASVLIIAALPSLIFFSSIGNAVRNISVAKTHPELKESEIYYRLLMSSVFREAGTHFTSMPGLEEEIRADLDELEQIGRELRADLKDNIDNREVVEALIRNYRLRIRMLEDLLTELSDSDIHTKNTNRNEL